MDTILQILQLVMYAAVSTLSVTLVIVLIRVRKILDVVEHDVKQISARAIPVLDNLEIITEKVRIITDSIGDQVDTMKQSINSFKEIADNVLAFEKRVQNQLEAPVMNAVEAFASIFRGIQSFINRIPFLDRLRA